MPSVRSKKSSQGPSWKKVRTMAFRLITAVVIVVVLAAVVNSLPDIKRYIAIRGM